MRFIAIMLLLVLAACAAEPQLEQEMPEEPQEEQVEESHEEQSETAGSDALRAELEGFLTDNPEYMVEYDFTADGYSGTLTMYMLDGKMRMDSQAEGVESRIYMADVITTCTNSDGWTCFQLGEPEESYAPTEQVDVEASMDDTGFVIVDVSSRTIAGAEARCFTIQDEGEYTICYADSGAMLAMEYNVEGEFMSYEATSYSNSVSESAFDLPAEPQSMEDMMPDNMEDYPSQYQ